MKFRAVLLLIVAFKSATSDREERDQNYCTTASCVHSASTILKNLDQNVNPCDDFYDYACGKFADELGVPDEKATINTLNRITERVYEFIFGLAYIDPTDDGDYKKLALKLPKHHRISKTFYNSCLDTDKIKTLGAEPLVKFLDIIGGWPMLQGKDWNADKFNWSEAIQSLKDVNKKGVQLKRFNDPDKDNEVDNLVSESTTVVKEAYKGLLFEIIDIITTKNDSKRAEKEIDDVIDFEFKLDDFSRKYKAYIKETKKKKNAVKDYYRDIVWFNLFQPSVFRNITLYDGPVGKEIVNQFADFLKNTPPRTIANHIATRIVVKGIYFLGEDFRNAIVKYDRLTNGNEDYEQRWKLCAVFLSTFAPVSIGSLYIERYFKPEDKKVAEEIMTHIVDAYVDNVQHSSWLNKTEQNAIADVITNKLRKFIGYDDHLLTDAANFYENLTDFAPDDFFNQAMALNIFNAERSFNQKEGLDWSKYSQPQTVNAFFNSKDDSIQFPAGIIQDPNFDPKRSGSMNFGALGGIISHELSHSYDTYVALLKEPRTQEIFKTKKQCIMEQYSSYHVKEVEEYLGKPFRLNGTATIREDFADTGAVKLSYEAFKTWLKKRPEQKIPIGLNDFSFDQIFWIAHGQTFCAYERATTTEYKVNDGKYSIERFRVNGPLSNSKEFQASFNCKDGSKMVRADDKKCLLW